MGLARCEAMDAQRFDPMRRMVNSYHHHLLPRDSFHLLRLRRPPPILDIPSAEKDMGQTLRRLSQQDLPPAGVVGGIWSDHELVLVPLEASESTRDSLGSDLAASASSPFTSEPTPSVLSYASSSSYFTTSSLDSEMIGALRMSSPSGSSSSSPSSSMESRQDTSDGEDLIITRTIIRPATQPQPPSSIRNMFSRPSSPTISRPTSPLSRPSSPVFQALNCFRPMVFEGECDGGVTQQVLQVIVTQTREQYERDLAFKEVVQEVYPEAYCQRQAIH